jgi:hypothetical protein
MTNGIRYICVCVSDLVVSTVQGCGIELGEERQKDDMCTIWISDGSAACLEFTDWRIFANDYTWSPSILANQ